MVHAQLNDSGICNGFSNLNKVESDPRLVFLPEGWNEDLLWRKYENGQWSSEKYEPPTPPYEKPLTEEVAELKLENTTLREQVAQTNADAVAFQEFIFEKFPELA